MILRQLWPRLRRFVPVSMYPWLAILYRQNVKWSIRRLDRLDEEYRRRWPGVTAPPARLRFKVIRNCTIDEFLASGRESALCLEKGLEAGGLSGRTMTRALDFGCGCGRTSLAFLERWPHIELHGADSDPEAIDWCNRHIQPARFSVTDALPPLPYADDYFDLVWAISVFTHLDEQRQFQWLAELRRILRPGGLLLASVHGKQCWQGLPDQTVANIQSQGFVFIRTEADRGLHPEWYQVAWHTEGYIRKQWSRYFDVCDYLPQGRGMSDQDLVVLRRAN